MRQPIVHQTGIYIDASSIRTFKTEQGDQLSYRFFWQGQWFIYFAGKSYGPYDLVSRVFFVNKQDSPVYLAYLEGESHLIYKQGQRHWWLGNSRAFEFYRAEDNDGPVFRQLRDDGQWYFCHGWQELGGYDAVYDYPTPVAVRGCQEFFIENSGHKYVERERGTCRMHLGKFSKIRDHFSLEFINGQGWVVKFKDQEYPAGEEPTFPVNNIVCFHEKELAFIARQGTEFYVQNHSQQGPRFDCIENFYYFFQGAQAAIAYTAVRDYQRHAVFGDYVSPPYHQVCHWRQQKDRVLVDAQDGDQIITLEFSLAE